VITKKRVEVELRFHGTGKIEEPSTGYFVGGLPAPKISGNLGFLVHRQVPDEDGCLNPIPEEGSYEGSIQVNLFGNTKGFRELGKYFLALAELDTRKDPDFHEHHDDLISIDGRSHIHLIVRKQKKQ